jgi:hypothetical protein
MFTNNSISNRHERPSMAPIIVYMCLLLNQPFKAPAAPARIEKQQSSVLCRIRGVNINDNCFRILVLLAIGALHT